MPSDRPVAAALIAALFLLMTMVGCTRPPGQLQYVDIGIAEDQSPLIFGLTVSNTGGSTVLIDGCDVEVTSTHIFPVDSGEVELPEKFVHYAELRSTSDGLTLQPGERTIVPIAFVWDLPPDAPDLAAICRARFSVGYNATFGFQTEPVMFLVASSKMARERFLAMPLDDIANAAEIVQNIDAFDGKKSAGVQQVVARLREGAGR